MNYLQPEVKHLHIFCDCETAGGQNKNFSMFRFMHFMVHTVKRLESIKITFPIRGHSYLECDKNMGIVNLKKRMELPDECYNGPWLQQPIMKAVKTNSNNLRLAENEFFLPSSKYHDEDKYMNLQILKGFCENPDAAVYYTQLQRA
ncbi:hypothetical protein QE152_g38737 [Popillia japonica]|uniref:Uncharacterized protein n=1 Tax=Popillia japonica TaxID=7064 RepID=A0AAW1HW68_POPJA